MKMLVVAFAFVGIAIAAPLVPAETAQVLRSSFNQAPEGSYNFDFETENGISRQEEGQLKEALDEENKPHSVITVRGSFTYIDNEGKPETINYYADETGYHAEGPSIPQVPARR